MAFLVMLSHIGVRFYGLNPGVTAVVIFYILAGFVVSHLYFDILPQTKYKILYFYRDRFLRIFPLYIYILLLTLLFLFITSFGDPNYSLKKLFYNVTIIPLNYYMYIDSTILTKPSWCLIPPAWSLGAELQAYILLSILFTLKKHKLILPLLSFVVYLIANFSIINPDYFGYRFIIGVFFIFFIGSILQRYTSKEISKLEKYFPLFVYITILLLATLFWTFNFFSPSYTKETFVGLFIGIPLVYTISKTSIKLPLNPLLGSLSYGLFLSHFLSKWVLLYFGFLSTPTPFYILLLFTLSITVSYFGVVFIERGINSIRFKKK